MSTLPIKQATPLIALCLALAVGLATPAARAQTLTHRFSFNEAAGEQTFLDSIAGSSGVLYSDPLFPGSASLDGSQLQLNNGGYGILPSPLINQYTQVTIEFWATYDAANPNWTRTFFFGSQNESGQKETGLDYSHQAPGGWQNLDLRTLETNLYCNVQPGLNGMTNIHVTCVVDPPAKKMFFYNGTVTKSAQHGVEVPALSGINEIYGLLGKSPQDVDAGLAGSIDEFRIYDGVLTRAQVALNDAAGPDSYLTSPGTLLSLQLAPVASLVVGEKAQLVFKGDFSAVTGLDLIAYGGATFESRDPAVFTVDAAGVVTATGLGTADLVASYDGRSVTNSLTVSTLPVALKHRYSFDADATDSVSGAHGTLMGDATVSGGKAVLTGTSGCYVDLPASTINFTNYRAVTFDTWVALGALGTWSRLFDFGELTKEIYFAPRSTGAAEHRLTMSGGGKTIEANKQLRNKSVHVTCVLDPTTGLQAIYLDGVLEYARYDLTAPLSTLSTNAAVLGRSLVAADPYMLCQIDEFRVYSGALSAQEIARSHASGPNSTEFNPGALQSITVSPVSYPRDSRQTTPVILANYENLTGFNLLPNTSARAEGLTLASSDTNILRVLANNMIQTFGPGEVTLTANYQGKTHSQVVQVVGTRAQLTHRYSFESDANDSIGTSHGTLASTNNTTVPVIVGGKAVFDGMSGYISLPGGLVTGYNGITIDTWTDIGAVGQWARLWFFGNNQRNEFYVTPRAGTANHRFSTGFIVGGGSTIDVPASWRNVSVHVTAVFGQGTFAIYTNGVLESAITTAGRPDQVGTLYSWMGRSPYNDPAFVGAVDEFRIYNGRLSAEEIQASDYLGPNGLLSTAPPALAAALGGENVTLSWPVAAAGFVVQSTDRLASDSWSIVTNAPTLVGDQWQLTLPKSAGAQFFRLLR